jgi:hypothetical protein
LSERKLSVLESREGRPLRLRPWVLLLGAGVAVAVVIAVVLLVSGSSTPDHPGSATAGSSSSGAKSGTGASAATSSSFQLASTSPAPGEQNVAPNATISLTFSAPVSLRAAAPTLTPNTAGKWVQKSPTTLTYALDSPLIPASQVTVTIPGGTHGLRSTQGATLNASHTVDFDVAAGDTLRLQQLLAQLNSRPLAPPRPGPTWPRTSPAPSPGAGPACRPSSPPSGPRAP